MSSLLLRTPVRRLFGIGVHAVTLQQAVALCREAVQSRGHLNIGVINAAKVIAMRRSPVLFEAVAGSDLVLADGMAVVWAARVLRQPLPARVAGIDLFEALLGLADEKGYGVYFLGAAQEVLEEVLRRVAGRWPRLRIAGSRNGYFQDAEAPAVAADVRRSGADLLFVAMTSPKKELFLGRFGRDLGVAVCHGVGGSFDVLAGKVRRAPRGWQAAGLEWLYRVLQEPRRMWKRYLVTNLQFAGLLAREALAGRPGREPGDAAMRRAHARAAGDGSRHGSRLCAAQLVESGGQWRVRLLPGLADRLGRWRTSPEDTPPAAQAAAARRAPETVVAAAGQAWHRDKETADERDDPN